MVFSAWEAGLEIMEVAILMVAAVVALEVMAVTVATRRALVARRRGRRGEGWPHPPVPSEAQPRCTFS
jgi:hypothetical protein